MFNKSGEQNLWTTNCCTATVTHVSASWEFKSTALHTFENWLWYFLFNALDNWTRLKHNDVSNKHDNTTAHTKIITEQPSFVHECFILASDMLDLKYFSFTGLNFELWKLVLKFGMRLPVRISKLWRDAFLCVWLPIVEHLIIWFVLLFNFLYCRSLDCWLEEIKMTSD